LKTLIKLFYCGILLLLLSGGQAIAAIQVQAQVDQSKPIYAGEQFSYQVEINGDNRPPDKVDISSLAKYDPQITRQGQFFNDRMGKVTKQYVIFYRFLAPEEGEHTIPSIPVKIKGKFYRTNKVTFKVVKPGSAKQIDVEIELSTQKSYVGQPIIMTLSFYVWTDIVRAKQIRNIDIRVPFLEKDAFIKEDIAPQFGRATKTVLSVNGRDEYVYQDQVKHNEVDCVRIRFAKALIPQTPGVFNLKPASVSASLAVAQKQNRNRDAFFRDFFGSRYEFKRFKTQTKPLQLKVEALPQKNVPSDFYGLVGNYTITADANPKEVNVGDPITLTIKIGGSRYLKTVRWPELESVPQMTGAFKIPSEYSDGEIKGRAKLFTQTIRANSEKVTEVPPIPLSFFDAKAGRYRTVTTKPIPLNVSATRMVTGADVESRHPGKSTRQIEAIREGLSANYTSTDALINEHFLLLNALTSGVFWILWAGPFVLLLSSGLGRVFLVNTPKRQAAAKRNNALSQAIKLIRTAEKHNEPSGQISLALKQYVADKFGKFKSSLTADDCRNILFEETGDVELSDAYHKAMERIEASEYSPMAFELTEEKRDEIIQLLKEIEKKVK
jgi:hypothetical protein